MKQPSQTTILILILSVLTVNVKRVRSKIMILCVVLMERPSGMTAILNVFKPMEMAIWVLTTKEYANKAIGVAEW